jgi:hypothetical protein
MKAKCQSIQEYIHEIIEAEEKYTLYFNATIQQILNGCKITEEIAELLGGLLDVQPWQIFMQVDQMYKIEQRYLKRKHI